MDAPLVRSAVLTLALWAEAEGTPVRVRIMMAADGQPRRSDVIAEGRDMVVEAVRVWLDEMFLSPSGS